MKEEELKKHETEKQEEIKPGGMTDGIMKEEAKTEIHNQRIKQDPETVNDILPEEGEEEKK